MNREMRRHPIHPLLPMLPSSKTRIVDKKQNHASKKSYNKIRRQKV